MKKDKLLINKSVIMKKKLSLLMLLMFFVGLLMITGCSEPATKTAKKEAPKSWVEVKPHAGNLCVGDYMTPEQGAAFLDSLASSYHNKEEWEARVQKVTDGFIKNSGFDQIPEEYWLKPFNPIIRNKHTMNGYIVENIAIEGMPGQLITGNIYRPISVREKVPAILTPHGHWYTPDNYGRFRPNMQKRCAALARMGAVVFAYDMVGFGEYTTIRHDDSLSLRIQTFNSKRVLDYLCSRDDVDNSRIGVTGASGGGTQTMYISLIDPRIKVSVPVVMVSSFFYGGCVCESGLPVTRGKDYATNLADIAAMFAPKPLLFVTDGNDWTRTAPKVEYPYIRNVYKLYDAEKNVVNVHLPNEHHSYGFAKRKPMYPFMAKHLGLDYKKILNKKGEIDESFITLLSTEDLKVFPDKPIAFVTHCCSFMKYSEDSPLYDKVE